MDPERPILTHGRGFEADESMTPHRHPRGQLLWSDRGILRITTDDTVWVVPSSHAVWIPGGAFHHMTAETDVRTRNLYVDSAYSLPALGNACHMLLLTPLMREIIVRLTSSEAAKLEGEENKRLCLVAIDEIQRLESNYISLPGGRDPRLRKVIGHLVRNPYEQCQLSELAQLSGASLRTIERLFKDETGLSFRQWKARLRLLGAIEYLKQGKSSTEIAYLLGFTSVSAFIAAFRQLFDCSPQQFLTTGPTQPTHLQREA